MSQRTSTDPSRIRGPVRRPSEVLPAPAAAWFLAVSLVALVVLTGALAVTWGPLERLDHTVAGWGYGLTYRHSSRSTAWTDIARWGQPMVLRVALVLTGICQLWRGRRALGIWLIAVPVAENLIAPFSKYLLNRPRPHWLHPIAIEHSTSYPSGHAAGAGMFAVAVALVVATTVRSRAARWSICVTALLIAITICLDRIFLGVHYLSDVVGGSLLGIAVTIAGWLVMLAGLRWTRQTKP